MRAPEDDLIPTRRSLLIRLKDWEDQESWRQFFESYWQLIYGLAIKCGLTEPEAQDAVQETMISVAKQMPGFRYDPALGTFKGWLLQISRRRITDQFRKREKALSGQPPARESDLRADSDARTDAVARIPDPNSQYLDAMFEQEWRQSLFQTALGLVKLKVSPKQFQMFDLYVNQQWPMQLVTSTLAVNRAQVYMAKMRVTKLIKTEVHALEMRTKDDAGNACRAERPARQLQDDRGRDS